MNAFKVLTEFRFDVASAVANSQTLQSEVGKISQAADNAHFALQRIGMGLVAQMGLGTGGVLGVFYKAIQASDKFYQQQLKISNILQSNGLFSGADGFRQSMLASESALARMAIAAREFSLPATDLANLSTQIGAVLTVKGLDDSSLGKSIDISRQFLKSAPILGVDPSLATQQLVGAVSGRAELGSTLVQRLIDETSAMKPYSGRGGLSKFNALDPAKRLDTLTKSLAQFSSNAKVTDAIAQSMSGQLRRLNDNLMSMFSIFKPLGDALMTPIKQVLNGINNWLEKQGAETVKIFAGIMGDLFKDPEKLFVGLQQLRKLQSDTQSAGKTLAIYGGLVALTEVLRFLGFQVRGGLLVAGLKHIGAMFMWIAGIFTRLGGFALIFRILAFAVSKVLAPLALFTMFFQAFSRGLAKAEIINAKWLADNMPRIMEIFSQLKRGLSLLFLPVTMAIDAISNAVAWIFRLDVSGGVLVSIFEGIAYHMMEFGKAMLAILSVVAGVTNAIIGLVFDLANMNFKEALPNIPKNFMEGMNDFWKLYDPNLAMEKQERNTSNRVTNIDKIEINNQFKEQLEPDRIAFTLKEMLFKAADNPKQSSGRSLKANAIGN